MSQRLAHIALVVLATGSCVLAQEKERPPTKPLPQERKLDLHEKSGEDKPSVPQAEGRRSAELPKIDLPEFVITGIASIDLPEVEKEGPSESAIWLPIAVADHMSASRDRTTVELTAREKSTVHVVRAPLLNGKVMGSLGSYFTPRVGLWLGSLEEEYSYTADFAYHSMKGYAPYTNRSGGQLAAHGGLVVQSSSRWLSGARAGGGLGYASETYRFFGSGTPSLTRTVSAFSLKATLLSSTRGRFDYFAALAFNTSSISDSSAGVTENQLDLRAESRFSVGSIPLLGKVHMASASLSGSSSDALTYLDAGLGTERMWWGDLFAQVSAHFYDAQGMLSQKLMRIYPHASLGCLLLGNTTVTLMYRGGVEFATLSSFLDSSPYLSATSLLRHADVRSDVSGAIETDWNEVWRTRLSARYRLARDYPLLTEGLHRGIWTTAYSGTTTLVTYRLELFAKFDPNGYFALSAAVYSSKNSFTQQKVPYVSDAEITGMYVRRVAQGFTISPWISFVGRRAVELLSGNRIPSFIITGLRAEYRLLQSLDILVDVRNASDRKYEVWRGYSAEPFMISAGASYRW